jgi:hypothetical protein
MAFADNETLDAERSERAYPANMAFDVAWITSSGFASPGEINPAIHRPVRGHKAGFYWHSKKNLPSSGANDRESHFCGVANRSAANRQFCGARGNVHYRL